MKTVKNYFINYNIQISNSVNLDSNNVYSKHIRNTEPNDIKKLECDPFIKIAKEKNPFSSQISQTREDIDDNIMCNNSYNF